jgi:hypothetical protein
MDPDTEPTTFRILADPDPQHGEEDCIRNNYTGTDLLNKHCPAIWAFQRT